jgi:hypothetical protein
LSKVFKMVNSLSCPKMSNPTTQACPDLSNPSPMSDITMSSVMGMGHINGNSVLGASGLSALSLPDDCKPPEVKLEVLDELFGSGWADHGLSMAVTPDGVRRVVVAVERGAAPVAQVGLLPPGRLVRAACGGHGRGGRPDAEGAAARRVLDPLLVQLFNDGSGERRVGRDGRGGERQLADHHTVGDHARSGHDVERLERRVQVADWKSGKLSVSKKDCFYG